MQLKDLALILSGSVVGAGAAVGLSAQAETDLVYRQPVTVSIGGGITPIDTAIEAASPGCVWVSASVTKQPGTLDGAPQIITTISVDCLVNPTSLADIPAGATLTEPVP